MKGIAEIKIFSFSNSERLRVAQKDLDLGWWFAEQTERANFPVKPQPLVVESHWQV